uniref:Uncharacterized protein n=1 Tax=Romanomermis culicivorax TaxID=13658 RepID=A0A915J886_ROMCU
MTGVITVRRFEFAPQTLIDENGQFYNQILPPNPTIRVMDGCVNCAIAVVDFVFLWLASCYKGARLILDLWIP